ncbi:MAG: SseB family protein [Lachnospiraceae bacterium]|nr:SseB family protein [Lachnospiraceae bacterium]
MKLNENVSNPMLVGAMQLMKAENTPEHQQLMTAELLKATLISPARITPGPIVDSEGNEKIPQGAQIQFPMLNANDGKKFFVAYTDVQSMRSNEENEKVSTPEEYRNYFVSLNIREFFRMLLSRDPMGNENPASGVVINPYGENVIVTKKMALAVMQQEMLLAQQMARKAQEAKEAKGGVSPDGADNVIPFPGGEPKQ